MDDQILIIFGTNISAITGHHMLVDSLSNCPVVQLLTANIRIIGYLYKHRQGDAFSLP